MKWRTCLGIVFTCEFALGCQLFGGLRVDAVATSVQKPSNVAVYLSVGKGDAPVLNLNESAFQLSEDGQELTPEQSRQVLLPRDMVAVHRALFLVDMSGPQTDETRNATALAVAQFVTKAHVSEPVTVYAFDGGAAIRFIGDYPEGTEDVGEITALQTYKATDPSSNLNGAVIEALAQLDTRLMSVQKPLRIGSLVVFARGTDLAGRVTEAKMQEALSDSKHLLFAVGVKDTPGFRPRRIGRDGVFEAESAASLLAAFDEAGARVASLVGRYYLLSYCSPSRAGTRRLRIKVVTTDDKDKEVSGTFSTEIDTDGFSSGCDPTARPRFVVAPASAAREEKKEKETEEPSAAKPTKSGPARAPKAEKPAAGASEEEDVVPPPAKPGYAQ